MKGRCRWLHSLGKPLSSQKPSEKPEEECSRQKEQQGWKDPGVFTPRIKAKDLSTAHKALYHLPTLSNSLHSAPAIQASSLFSEDTCLRAFALAVPITWSALSQEALFFFFFLNIFIGV